METMASDGPKWGQENFYPTNPYLADILGRMDLNFENLYIFHFLDPKFLDFQVPKFWISKNLDFPASKILDFPASKKRLHFCQTCFLDCASSGKEHNYFLAISTGTAPADEDR